MRTQITKRLAPVVSVVGCLCWPLLVSSCTTTGDPSTGGIFWSESKAQQRLDERQKKLDQIESQTAHANQKAANKEGDVRQLQR